MTDPKPSSAPRTALDAARRPKVMLVGPMPPTKGGVTTFMLNLMGSYLNAEFEFVPYTVTRPPKKDVVDNWGYGAIFQGGVKRMIVGIALTIGRLAAFPFVLVLRRIDLVQIQASDYQVFWESVAYALAARMMCRPVLFRIGGAFDLFHGASAPRIKRLIAASLNVPQCVIVQSRFAQDYVQGVNPKAALLILPNWTRHSIVATAARPATDHPKFLFIAGTEARRKGFEEVFAAIQQLDRAGSPARFHLTAMVPQLIRRIEQLNVKNIARIDGPIDNERMMKAMQEADVFLLPSHGEGFPNSLLEAMAAGMASVVTPIAAVPEIVARGGAVTVPVKDSAALCAAIGRLAADGALRQKLGEEARNIVRENYTAESVLPSLAQMYRRLLQPSTHLRIA